MPDKTNIASESEGNIDHEHDQDLIRHGMVGRMEIDPEIGEERHTEARYPDRESTYRCEHPECCSNEECIQDEKYIKMIRGHPILDLWSCLIEEIRIHENMKDIPMEELVEENLTDEHDNPISCKWNPVKSKKADNTRQYKSENWYYNCNNDQQMWKIFSRIEWKWWTRLIHTHKKTLKDIRES